MFQTQSNNLPKCSPSVSLETSVPRTSVFLLQFGLAVLSLGTSAVLGVPLARLCPSPYFPVSWIHLILLLGLFFFIFWPPWTFPLYMEGPWPETESDLPHSCSSTGSLTYCARAGDGTSNATEISQIINPLGHSANSTAFVEAHSPAAKK